MKPNWKIFSSIVVSIFLVMSACALAEDIDVEVTKPAEATTEPLAVPQEMEAETEEAAAPESASLLNVGVRIDSAFSTGSPIQQGFYIPSVRLSAFGQASPAISYRLSLGQSREFSAVLIPQLVPVEAYVDVGKLSTGRNTDLTWRMGLFTPTLVPWWTPDLSDIDLPDYHEMHRRMFISRDIGTELVYKIGRHTVLSAGAFNGSGLYSLNTNSSRAFTGSMRFNFGPKTFQWTLGVAGYTVFQSTATSVNYRRDWVADAFLSVAVPDVNFLFGLELVMGNFDSFSTSVTSYGGAVQLRFALVDWLLMFGRYEMVPQAPPSGAGLLHVQAGPEFILSPRLKAYVLFDLFNPGSGPETTGLCRVRLNI